MNINLRLNGRINIPFLILTLLIAGSCITNSAFAQQQWRVVGDLGISAGVIRDANIAIDRNNVPYVVFSDNGNAYDGKVMKYDAATDKWITIGNFPSAQYMSIAIDSTNTPVIVIADGSIGNKATVLKYNNGNWSVVGWSGLSALNVYHNDIAINSKNNILITHLDYGFMSEVTALIYDGGWREIGIPSFTAYWPVFNNIAVDRNDVPYVIYTDRNNGNKATVIKYAAGKWGLVGPNGLSKGHSQNTDIAIDGNNVPYVIYSDLENGYRGTVKKFDGSNWVDVGDSVFSVGRVHQTRIVIDGNNVPYIVYSDWADTNKTKVMKFDGTQWVLVGASAASAGAADWTAIAIDKNNQPYVVYKDYTVGQKVTVMRFGCLPATQSQLCGVLTDTSTANNTILWDTTGVVNADSYHIYRDEGAGYKHIGSVSASALPKYIDASATPNMQSYKYKITVADSCGVETRLDSSIAHQSIHLSFFRTPDHDANLVWSAYEGIPTPSYIVMRSINGGPYTILDTVTTTGYTDNSMPLPGNVTYRVAIAVQGCLPGWGYNTITSNVATAWGTGIETQKYDNGIVIVPNPAQDYVRISFTEDTKATSIKLLNTTGQVVLIQQLTAGATNYSIPLNNIPNGIYIVEVKTDKGKLISKLVKQ